ncbi:MAG: hypothetical protein HOY78_30940 [Saccharothrix sp.]|nr:hypothetical protein [Saccharothrix sp.]
MRVGGYGRAVAAVGLVVGTWVALGPSAGAADGPEAFKAVIDEKATKGADGYEFTGTVACPEQESPLDFTKVVLVVRQEKAVAKAESDEVQCQDGGNRADGKWKVVVKPEKEQAQVQKQGELKPGKGDAYVVIVQGTTFDMGKGAVTLGE